MFVSRYRMDEARLGKVRGWDEEAASTRGTATFRGQGERGKARQRPGTLKVWVTRPTSERKGTALLNVREEPGS